MKFNGGVSPNILIVGAVSGFALYLLWKWTAGDEGGGGVIGGGVAGSVGNWLEEKHQENIDVAKQLPFTPFWWWDKIAGAYNDIGGSK